MALKRSAQNGGGYGMQRMAKQRGGYGMHRCGPLSEEKEERRNDEQ